MALREDEKVPILNNSPVFSVANGEERQWQDYASVVDVERASAFKCGGHLNQGQACSSLFSPEEMVKKRDQIQGMTPCK